MCRHLLSLFAAFATRFATVVIVRYGEGVVIVHNRLEAGVWAHIDADLLAHPASVQVSSNRKETDPEDGPGTDVSEGEYIDNQLANRSEVTNEGDTRPESNNEPGDVLDALFTQFLCRHRRFIQLHPLVAGTFSAFFDPHENERPRRLRAGVAAPDPPRKNW